jgi:hypothetical protein
MVKRAARAPTGQKSCKGANWSKELQGRQMVKRAARAPNGQKRASPRADSDGLKGRESATRTGGEALWRRGHGAAAAMAADQDDLC